MEDFKLPEGEELVSFWIYGALAKGADLNNDMKQVINDEEDL
jgi:hypothetical protein